MPEVSVPDMPRTTVTRQTIVLDPVSLMTQIGELTKLGRFLGYDVVITPTEVEGFNGSRIVFDLNHECWSTQALQALAMITAVVNDRSGQQVLDDLKRELEESEFPLDRPISDVMEIGGGANHEGHHHADDED